MSIVENSSFETQLENCRLIIRVVDLSNQFERRSKSLLWHWNHAEELNEAALLIGNAKLIPGNVFCLLAGLSIELLLKGILLGLVGKFPRTHKLLDLSTKAGISCNDDEVIILQSMTEYITWASKYPTPKDEKSWHNAQEVFQQQRNPSGKLGSMHIPARQISIENYERSWLKYSGYFWRIHEHIC